MEPYELKMLKCLKPRLNFSEDLEKHLNNLVKGEEWYSASGYEIENPHLQLRRTETLFRRLLQSMRIYDLNLSSIFQQEGATWKRHYIIKSPG